ncbi:MAG TPA: rhombosortase [Gammaproteobacteria bacterium]
MNSGHVAAGTIPSIRQRAARWVPVLVLAAAVLALGFGGDAAREALRYEREALQAGEVWRLLTGHLVHLGWGHVVMNLAALFLIASLIDDAFATADWIGAFAASALAIDGGLYFFAPEIDWYVGLSGVLHGLVAAGAVALLRSFPLLAWLLGAGLAVKLAYEQRFGPIPLSVETSGGAVIVAAHLYGAIGGFAFALLRRAVPARKAASL